MKTIVFEGKIGKIIVIKALSKLSKGAYHLSCSPIKYLRVPKQELPNGHWVRVKNIMTGICGSDMTFYTCKQGPSTAFLPLPASEVTYLGHETVGVVTEVGNEVKKFKVGDRVTMNKYLPCCNIKDLDEECEMCKMGNYADCENYGVDAKSKLVNGAGFSDEYLAPEGQLLKIDDKITNEQAVLIEPFAVSLHSVLKCVPKQGDKVLVIGAGMIGLNVIQFIKHFQPDCKVYVMEKNKKKHDFAKKLGADEFLQGDPYEAVAKATNAKVYGKGKNRMVMGGFDVIFDTVGKGRLFNDTQRWLKAQGTLVKVGYQMTSTKFDETPLWWQGLNIIGVDSHGKEIINGKEINSFDYVQEQMKAGKLITDGFITHKFKLDEYKKAFNLLIRRPQDAVKVVLVCDKCETEK